MITLSVQILLILWNIVPSQSVFNEFDLIYNDTETRQMFEMIAAVHGKFPEFCLARFFYQ